MSEQLRTHRAALIVVLVAALILSLAGLARGDSPSRRFQRCAETPNFEETAFCGIMRVRQKWRSPP